MIKEIYLQNWKSFQDGKLFVDPLTILIGTNASGKSNVLDALLFLQKISVGKSINAAINGDAESRGIRGGSEWIIRKGAKKTVLSIVIGDHGIDFRYTVEIGKLDENRIELKSESLEKLVKNSDSKKLFYTSNESLDDWSIATYFSTKHQEETKKIDLKRAYSVLSQTKLLASTKEVDGGVGLLIRHLSQIFILDPIPVHMRNYSKFSDRLSSDASNISGVLAAIESTEKAVVEKMLTDFLSRLPEKEITRVWTESVGKFNSDAMLYCSEKWNGGDEFVVDARGMSDGTLRFLGIMTALLTIEENSLLVIEEIDNGFHPSRANILVQFLKEIGAKRKIDIICTTHNPAFLDALGNEMIVFISVVFRNKNNGSSEIKLLEDVSELPRLLARGSIGKLTSSGLIEKAIKK